MHVPAMLTSVFIVIGTVLLAVLAKAPTGLVVARARMSNPRADVSGPRGPEPAAVEVEVYYGRRN